MPHLLNAIVSVPPLIDAAPGFRAILRRADEAFDLGSLRSVETLLAMPLTLDATQPCHPAAWASAVPALTGEIRRTMPAFATGFAAALVVAVLIVAAAPASPPIMASGSVSTGDVTVSRLAAFATQRLPAAVPFELVPAGPSPLKVAGEIEIEVGRSLPFHANVEAEQREASDRIGTLPRYAGLASVAPRANADRVADVALLPAAVMPAIANAVAPVQAAAAQRAPIEAPAAMATPAIVTVKSAVAKTAARPLAPSPVAAVKTAATRPKAAQRSVKVVLAEPKPASAAKIVAERAAKPRPAAVIAEAPASSRLPWSHAWMRSTLGMGRSGP